MITHRLDVPSREDESVYFEIERSLDGINFRNIGTVSSLNNSASETNLYSFIDPDYFDDKAWYRIVIVNQRTKKIFSDHSTVTRSSRLRYWKYRQSIQK